MFFVRDVVAVTQTHRYNLLQICEHQFSPTCVHRVEASLLVRNVQDKAFDVLKKSYGICIITYLIIIKTSECCTQ